jgi:hypothetical protein
MKKWFGRVGRAAMMGLAWAGAWVPVGAVLGGIIAGELEPEHIGGPLYAGFLCGALFSAVAGIASGRRTPAGLSLSLAGARGALSGLLGGGLWMLLVFGGGPGDDAPWLLFAAVVGALTLISAASGVGSALLARALDKRAGTSAA